MIHIKEGDFVVTEGSYSVHVKKVLKVTASFFYHSTDYRDMPVQGTARREHRGDIVFAGPEQNARELAANLTKARADRAAAERAAFDEWKKTKDGLIAAANSALTARNR